MSNLTLKNLLIFNIRINKCTYSNIQPIYSLINNRSYCNAISNESNYEEVPNNISRLPKSLHDRVKRAPVIPDPGAYSFKEQALKSQQLAYKLSGRDSGVDAGHCWPCESKLDEIINDEKIYESTLFEMMDTLSKEQKHKQLKKNNKEKKVMEQMAKMPKLIEDYKKRLQKMENVEAASLSKRKDERSEAREYFGFEIDPRDPRYEHMQEVKAEQMKQDRKLKKKEEKQARLLASLSAGTKKTK